MAEKLLFERKKTVDEFTTERIDAIENQLLGGYTPDGEYYIPNEIVKELIAIEKIKKSAFNSSIFCVSNLAGFGEMMFELKVEPKNDEIVMGRLYLLETVYKINGYLQNTIRTEIARIETDNESIVERAYDKFNIKVKYDDEEGKDYLIKDNDLFNGYCMAKKQFCIAMKDLMNDKAMDLYGKYFQTRMLLLKKTNSNYSRSVIDLYNQEVKKIEKYFYKYATNKNRNELLDKCFEDIDGQEKFKDQENDYKIEQDKITAQFIEEMDLLEEQCEVKAIDNLKKNDKDKINDMRTMASVSANNEEIKPKTEEKAEKEAKEETKGKTDIKELSKKAEKLNFDKSDDEMEF